MVVYLSLLVAVIGALMYFFVSDAKYPKLVELGRITYAAGLLAFLLEVNRAVAVLGK